jgi:shikimate kinase
MGVGKTSLGKKLAKELGWQFIDTDKLIENNIGLTIPEIFKEKGEEFFRVQEKHCLTELKSLQNHVISVGGGLPCFGENMNDLNSIGTTIYLQLEIKEIINRLEQSKKSRPLLSGLADKNLESYIINKLQERESFYMLANYTIRPDRYFLENCIQLLKSIE